MKRKRCLACLILLLLPCLVSFLAIKPSKQQLQWATHIQIEVSEDGSAAWVVQQKAPITNESDMTAFWQYLNITSLDDISGYIHSIVDHASLITGRSMAVEGGSILINANVSLLGKEGIFQYQFDWMGFAERIDDNEIRIGDSLSGEIDLGRDDMLTVEYPIGYSVTTSYPTPDTTRESERTFTWFGPRNFGAGEPSVLLEKTSSTWVDIMVANAALFAVIAAAVAGALLGYIIGLKRYFTKMPKTDAKPEQMLPSASTFEDDKDRVLRLLSNAGGRMQQSLIAEHCGFSKSKTSELLAVMERDGMVMRKKMGRGKVVTLIKSQQEQK